MNCDTLTISRDDATRQLAQYERAALDRPQQVTSLDEQIMRALKVGASGGRLLDLNAAIASGGANRAGLPKLAFARADAKHTNWLPNREWNVGADGRHTSNGGGAFYFGAQRNVSSPHQCQGLTWNVSWTVPPDTLPHTSFSQWRPRYKALAPLIPLPVRPKAHLKNFALLWEANWHPDQPPVDPFLLRPLTGSLFEIVAEWDVTPLELAAVRSALRG